MIRQLKRFFLVIIGLYLIALGIDAIFSNLLLNSSILDGEFEIWNDINNKRLNDELIIYGSSRSCVHINPKILDEELNVNSYNLGYNGQKAKLVRYRNDVILKKGIKPKNVIINLDIDFLSKTGVFIPEQFLPLLFFDYEAYVFFRKDLKWRLIDVYVPLVRYRKLRYTDSKIYEDFCKSNFGFYSKRLRYKGFEGKHLPWSNNNYKTYAIDIDPLSKKDLILMIQDLQRINTNVILINSPEYIKQIKSQNNREEIIQLYKSIAQQFNIPFIDYSKDSINFQKNLFYDSNHLNAEGADIFTKKLAKDIKPYIKR